MLGTTWKSSPDVYGIPDGMLNDGAQGNKAQRARRTQIMKLDEYIRRGLHKCEASPSGAHEWVDMPDRGVWECRRCHEVRKTRSSPLSLEMNLDGLAGLVRAEPVVGDSVVGEEVEDQEHVYRHGLLTKKKRIA